MNQWDIRRGSRGSEGTVALRANVENATNQATPCVGI